MIHFLIFHI